MSHAMRHRTRAAALLMLLLSACNWGRRGADFPPAVGPQGATVSFRAQGDRAYRTGELYAVDSVGVTVFAGRVVHMQWPRVQSLDVQYLGGDFHVSAGETPSEAKRNRLAGVSRFPQGLSGDLLARVLASHKQTDVDEVP